jgi:hypothetical protein
VSLFSRLDNRWHQTYIDSNGNRAVLVGVLEEGVMILYTATNARSTWEPLDADRVRFRQEQRTGGAWVASYDSTYVRR